MNTTHTDTSTVESLLKDSEKAHYMSPDEYNIGGRGGLGGYWRKFQQCSDGAFIIAVGTSAKDVERRADQNVATREAQLVEAKRMPADVILNRVKTGCRGTKEQDEFNLAVARHLGILRD